MQCAIGHTLVELPLVLGLALGTLAWLQRNPLALRIIGLTGGSVLVFFATQQAWEARYGLEHLEKNDGRTGESGSPIAMGAVFTALNPFFIFWWLSVGWTLVVEAAVLGALAGVLIMYLAHIWMDYAWLGGAGFVASRREITFGKWYRILLIVFAIIMLYFGITFIASSVS